MKTVVIVGAGVSGLTTARALRQAGHRAIVLERGADVGGKCASVDIGGHAFDLGGHVCTTQYRRLAALVTELGLETEPTTPHRVFDAANGESRPQSSAFFTYENFQRYTAIREAEFPRLGDPGLAHSAKALSIPASQWLREQGLEAMAESFGTGYTAAGYGRLDEVPALYFLKYAEMTGLLSSTRDLLGHVGSFTIKGGFGSLWQRVAQDLDVRLNVEIEQIVRNADGVRVKAGEWIEADAIVLTVPIDQVPALDATPEERGIAARVRYLDYSTMVCAAEGLPREAFSLVAQPRNVVSFHHRYEDSDVYTCYAYGADAFDEDVTVLGGLLRKPYLRKDWKFLPHFGSDDLATGVLDRVEALQGELNTFHVGSLPAFELVECAIVYAEDLVAEHFGAATGSRAVTTTQTIREWLVKHIAAELHVPEFAVSPSAPLTSLGLESLSVATLQSELSDWLGFRVPHTLFLELPTVDAVAENLARQDVPQSSSSLALALTTPRPFFCIGGAVGAAYYLLPLARAVGQGQPFYGLQGPGFDGTEEPVDDIPELAARYVAEIKQVQPYGPYLVGGHSFGGIVAYEVGRQLRRRGDEVARVIMIDAYPAVPGQQEPPWDERAVIEELWTIRQHSFQDNGAPRRRVDQSLTPAEQREQLGRFLGASGARPVEEHIATIMGVYQAQVEALVRYEPPASDLDVTLIKATGGFPEVLKDDRHVELFSDSPANGWERVPMGSLEVVSVPGDHFTMLVPPALTTLANAVRTAIAQVPPPPPPPAAHVESSIHINPMHPDFLADPYPFYALLRDLAPVHYDDALDGWVLTSTRTSPTCCAARR
ncbi:FAD-dependent oxidoreductase [Lentzea sp. PSKA42]|uniref:FAD-dependent oxidoreductase n=1 Tax=Lentzea indica TaxID=2604800 RepID=A0ABX1FSI1_9PSEU|nr:FAD-dependent oxidoreductase [Lentzea indica]NKE61875.1 FAD-dependent oxidoreductase [Lentzea indica]